MVHNYGGLLGMSCHPEHLPTQIFYIRLTFSSPHLGMRWLLGMFEAGLFPGVNYYLSWWVFIHPFWAPRAMCSALETPRHTPVWHGAHLNLCWPLFATLQANASDQRACASRNVTKHPSTQEQSMPSVVAVALRARVLAHFTPFPASPRIRCFLRFFFPALPLL